MCLNFVILVQVPCYFHSKYKSSQSSTYRKNGLFLSHIHYVFKSIIIIIFSDSGVNWSILCLC